MLQPFLAVYIRPICKFNHFWMQLPVSIYNSAAASASNHFIKRVKLLFICLSWCRPPSWCMLPDIFLPRSFLSINRVRQKSWYTASAATKSMHDNMRFSTSASHSSLLSWQHSKILERIGIVDTLQTFVLSGCRKSTTTYLLQSTVLLPVKWCKTRS